MTETSNETEDTKTEIEWVASNISKFIRHDSKHTLISVRTLPKGTEYVGTTLPVDVQIATHKGPDGPLEYVHFPLIEDVIMDQFAHREEVV